MAKPSLVELNTERFAMAYQLVLSYAFVRPESEQNCSHLRETSPRAAYVREPPWGAKELERSIEPER